MLKTKNVILTVALASLLLGALAFSFQLREDSNWVEGPYFTIYLPENFSSLRESKDFRKETKERDYKYVSGCKIFTTGGGFFENIMCVREDPNKEDKLVTYSFSRINEAQYIEEYSDPKEYMYHLFYDRTKEVASQLETIEKLTIDGNPGVLRSSPWERDLVFERDNQLYRMRFEASFDDKELVDIWNEFYESINTIQYK